MSYSREWNAARERIAAWWAGEDIGRPILHIVVPSAGKVEYPAPPDSLEARYTDIDYRVALAEARWRSCDYVAEGFFSTYADLGPAVVSAFLGCDLIFQETTSWQLPIVEDWDAWQPRFDPNNRWWRLNLEMTKALAEAGRDRWVTSPNAGDDPFDVMSHLRGPQRLCMDLLDRPDKIREVSNWLTGLLLSLYDEQFILLQSLGVDGSSSWMPVWSPGRFLAMQCDFSCMVGPEMFREFIRPPLVTLARSVDHCVYHWDGPGALPHLRHLLSIAEIPAIQWVPGAGNRAQTDWPNLLRLIAAHGKALQIYCSAEEVLRLIEYLPPKLLWCSVSGLSSREEAEAFVKEVERSCKQKRTYNLPSPDEPYWGEEWYRLPRPV